MTNIRKRLMLKWRQQVNQNTCVCYLCGQLILNQNELSADHVVPLSKGGITSPDNLRPAHKVCNSKKGNMSLKQYLEKQHEKPK